MNRDNRCVPGNRSEIHDEIKKEKRKTDLEGLSRDGCSLSLGRGPSLGYIMDD